MISKILIVIHGVHRTPSLVVHDGSCWPWPMLPRPERSKGLLEKQSNPGIQQTGKRSTGMVVMVNCYNKQAGGPC